MREQPSTPTGSVSSAATPPTMGRWCSKGGCQLRLEHCWCKRWIEAWSGCSAGKCVRNPGRTSNQRPATNSGPTSNLRRTGNSGLRRSPCLTGGRCLRHDPLHANPPGSRTYPLPKAAQTRSPHWQNDSLLNLTRNKKANALISMILQGSDSARSRRLRRAAARPRGCGRAAVLHTRFGLRRRRPHHE